MRKRRSNRRFKNNYLLEDLSLIKRVLATAIIILLIAFIYSAIKVKSSTLNSANNNQEQVAEENSNKESVENSTDKNSTKKNSKDDKQKETNINLAFTGDIMCHNTVYNDAYDVSTRNLWLFSYVWRCKI